MKNLDDHLSDEMNRLQKNKADFLTLLSIVERFPEEERVRLRDKLLEICDSLERDARNLQQWHEASARGTH